MIKYVYEGPVMSFDRIIDNNWKGETHAISKRKAKSNLSYQFKKKYGYANTMKIHLPKELEIG